MLQPTHKFRLVMPRQFDRHMLAHSRPWFLVVTSSSSSSIVWRRACTSRPAVRHTEHSRCPHSGRRMYKDSRRPHLSAPTVNQPWVIVLFSLVIKTWLKISRPRRRCMLSASLLWCCNSFILHKLLGLHIHLMMYNFHIVTCASRNHESGQTLGYFGS